MTPDPGNPVAPLAWLANAKCAKSDGGLFKNKLGTPLNMLGQPWEALGELWEAPAGIAERKTVFLSSKKARAGIAEHNQNIKIIELYLNKVAMAPYGLILSPNKTYHP